MKYEFCWSSTVLYVTIELFILCHVWKCFGVLWVNSYQLHCPLPRESCMSEQALLPHWLCNQKHPWFGVFETETKRPQFRRRHIFKCIFFNQIVVFFYWNLTTVWSKMFNWQWRPSLIWTDYGLLYVVVVQLLTFLNLHFIMGWLLQSYFS